MAHICVSYCTVRSTTMLIVKCAFVPVWLIYWGIIWALHKYCVCLCLDRTLGEPRKMPATELSYVRTHKTSTCVDVKPLPTTSIHHTNYVPHTRTSGTRVSVWFQTCLLPPRHSNSQAATHRCGCQFSKQMSDLFQGEVQCIVQYLSILTRLTYAKLGDCFY